MIFDYIEAAIYINLDYRTDRRQAAERRFKELGISAERFDAVQLNLNEIDNPNNDELWHKKMGCTQSHFKCVRLAKERGLKNIWIMEDDIKFVPEFLSKAQLAIDELRTTEWDMFFFGGEPNRKCIPHSQHIVKTNGVYGAHSYLVNHTFYDKLLTLNVTNCISDIIYLAFDEEQKNFFLSKELLCLQDSVFKSDLWGGKVHRDILYKTAYERYVDKCDL